MVHYIDNESVRLALLRGSGETTAAKHVAARIMDSEYQVPLGNEILVCKGTKR